MTAVFVITFGIKDGKHAEFQAIMKKFLKFKKANPKLFEGVGSWRIFQQEYGGVLGTYVEMVEFKSIEEMEKIGARIMKQKETKEFFTEYHKIADPTTPITQSIWNTVV
jgi:hypothetical protein